MDINSVISGSVDGGNEENEIEIDEDYEKDMETRQNDMDNRDRVQQIVHNSFPFSSIKSRHLSCPEWALFILYNKNNIKRPLSVIKLLNTLDYQDLKSRDQIFDMEEAPYPPYTHKISNLIVEDL